MEVKNDKKVMFKDMLPIDMQSITLIGRYGRQFYSAGYNIWSDDYEDVICPSTIYRTKPPKPKTITPNELYEKVDCLPVSGFRLDVLNLIKRLEGFKDE